MGDARLAFLTVSVGLVLLGWAWWQSSGTGNARHLRHLDALSAEGMKEHGTYTTVGVIAVMLVALGCASWVLAGRRAVRVRRADVVAGVERIVAGRVGDGADEQKGDARLVAMSGSDRFHRHSCVLVRGKPVQGVAATRRRAGMRACEMCRP